MDKSVIRQLIIERLNSNLETALDAVDIAHASATHKENVPENKYDTLGLEASYLAHGQSKRVEEIQQALDVYRRLPIKDYTEQSVIGLSALVKLSSYSDVDLPYEKTFFIGPEAGGLMIQSEVCQFMLITPLSPLGGSLIGKMLGDTVELRVNGILQTLEIMDVR